MTSRDTQIITYIDRHQGVSSEELAAHFDVSARTIRTWVASANDFLGDCGKVEHARGMGYRLNIADQVEYARLMERGNVRRSDVPDDSESRCSYLLNDLLWRDSWVTLDVLADSLYISRSTISRDMRQVEETLSRHGLALARKPYKGVRIEGPEEKKRLLLASLSVEAPGFHAAAARPRGAEQGAPRESDDAKVMDLFRERDLLSCIADVVNAVFEQDGIEMSQMAYQSLMTHLAIAIIRVKEGSFVSWDDDQLGGIRSADVYASAQRISDGIREATGIAFPEDEVAYIAIHLSGRQTLLDEAEGNLVISDEVWDVVNQMIGQVSEEYRFDFRGDLELAMNLARHIVPLSVRLQHGFSLKNPLASHIKQSFPLAFSMAHYSSSVLARTYGTAVTDDEVAYLALAFALALDRQKSDVVRKSILVVCASGVGSARLLEHRCLQEFGEHIQSIETCDVSHVSKVDFSRFDYVFTTVPLSCEVPVPVRQVSLFLDEEDVRGVRQLFQQDADGDLVRGAFSEELLFQHHRFATKWDALEFLCERVMELGYAGPELREGVFGREREFPTSFGNLLAVPHAAEPSGYRLRVAVLLLDEPIVWDDWGHEVRAVFLVTFSEGDKGLASDLFSLLAQRLISKEGMEELLRSQDWDTLQRLISPEEPD